MPAAFAAIEGVPEFLDGPQRRTSRESRRSRSERSASGSRPVPDPSVAPDRRPDGHRRSAGSDGPRPAAPDRHGPVPDVAHTPDRRDPRAQSASLADPGRAPRPDRVSRVPLGLRDRRRPAVRATRLARDLLPQDLEAHPARAPLPRRASSRRPRRTPTSPSSTPAARLASNRGPADARSPASPARQDFVWGALGRFALPATGLIPPGILGHDPGRRQPHLAAREGHRDDPLGRASRRRCACAPPSTPSSRTSTPR